MNNFDCNKCMHKNVCYYKEQVPKYEDREADSMFVLTLSCKEYREMVTIPRLSEPVVIPYSRGWATNMGSQETECSAYRSYIERAKDNNWVGDSPCSYCTKTDCPRSQTLTCSNANTET